LVNRSRRTRRRDRAASSSHPRWHSVLLFGAARGRTSPKFARDSSRDRQAKTAIVRSWSANFVTSHRTIATQSANTVGGSLIAAARRMPNPDSSA
jgi:hypothetical protein